MNNESQRMAFERWARNRGLRIRRHDIREYWYTETMGAWEGWQAALHHESDVVRLKDSLRQISRGNEPSEDDGKEDFERWISEEGEYYDRLRLDHKGDYASYSTYAQWQIWQAALRYARKQS